MINTFKFFMEVTKYSSTITYFLFFYDHILIQEQNYEHVSNNIAYLQNVPLIMMAMMMMMMMCTDQNKLQVLWKYF